MSTEKTGALRIYKCDVRLEKKIFVPFQLLAVVVLSLGLYFSLAWYWLVTACLPFEVASIAILWWPVIDPEHDVLCERALLFGKKSLSQRITPLKEFNEVFYEYVPSDGDGNYHLGL